jgi:RNA polymerase sigma factor (sigma-70 family)
MEFIEYLNHLELKENNNLINYGVWEAIRNFSLENVNIEELKTIATSSYYKVKIRKANKNSKKIGFNTILVNRIKYDIIDYLRKENNLNKIKEIYRESQPENIYDITEAIENKVDLGKAINILTKKERKVIELYFFKGLTLLEIGKVFDLDESRISQLRSKALIKLKEYLVKDINYKLIS